MNKYCYYIVLVTLLVVSLTLLTFSLLAKPVNHDNIVSYLHSYGVDNTTRHDVNKIVTFCKKKNDNDMDSCTKHLTHITIIYLNDGSNKHRIIKFN